MSWNRLPLVGRERELQLVSDALDRAIAGSGHVVLLSGEAGIGKTRLLEEIAGAAKARGAQVRWGRCSADEGAPALWPWVEILRAELRARSPGALRQLLGAASDIPGLIPEIGSHAGLQQRPLAAPASTARLLDDIIATLRRVVRRRPLLVLVDDLEGADATSLLLLEALGRVVSRMRLLIVAAHRSAPGTSNGFRQRIEAVARQPSTLRLELAPLAKQDIAEMVDTLNEPLLPSTMVGALHGRSDGNPLFLSELVWLVVNESPAASRPSVAAQLPLGLQYAITRHLRPLSAGCRCALQSAAVLGRAFEADILAALMGKSLAQTTQLIGEAVAAGLLTDVRADDGRYRFVHAIVHEALYTEHVPTQRQRLHCLTGDILARRPDAEARISEIAHHFLEGVQNGDDALRAVEYAQRAAKQAMRILAIEEAVRFYQAALSVLDRCPAGTAGLRPELLLELGEACNRAGETTRGKEIFAQAMAAARASGDREQMSRAALGYCAELALPERGDVDRVQVELIENALAAWGADDHELHSRLLGRLAAGLFFTGQRAKREALCADSLEMARRLRDPHAVAHALSATHLALWGPNPHQRLRTTDQLLELARDLGDRGLAFTAHHWRFCAALDLGDRSAVDSELQACRLLAERLRQPHHFGLMTISRTTLALLEGHAEEAEHLLNRTMAQGQWLGQAVEAVVAIQMFGLRTMQGRCEEIIDFVRAGVAMNPGLPAMRAGLALLLARTGQLASARAVVERLVDAIDELPWNFNVLPALAHYAEVCVLTGDSSRAAIVHAHLLPYDGLSVTIGNGTLYFGCVAHYLALLETVLGRTDEAIRHYETVLATYASLGARPWRALAEYDYAVLCWRDPREAAAAYGSGLARSALSAAKTLGMSDLEAKAEQLLAARQPQALAADAAPPSAPGAAIHRDQGGLWIIGFQGRTVYVRDTKGVQYLARLLEHPGKEISVRDLSGVRGEDANEAAALAVNERARSAVCKRIRDAIKRIANADADLGHHLSVSVMTGYACSYRPSETSL